MGDHGIDHYWRTYQYLVGLFIISFIGPLAADALELEGAVRLVVVLTTAFVVAFIKAGLVIKNFMHLGQEKRFMHYALVTSLVFMGMFVFGVSSDVMNHHGSNWENKAAQDWVAMKLEEGEAGGGHHGDGHGDDHGEDHGDDHGEDHGDDHGDDHAEGGEH